MRRSLAIVAAAAMGWSTLASAGGRRVVVLPIDGDADPALRQQLTAIVVALVKSEGDDVVTADTSFAESASALGCDPHAPACVEQVRAGLDVDEIVFGSAFSGGDQTTAVISKVETHQPRQDQTVSIGAHQSAASAEATLRPMFAGATPRPVAETASGSESVPASASASGSGSGSGSISAVTTSDASLAPHETWFSTRDRKLGFGLAAGGGLVFCIGLALWASESGLQGQIDASPANTSAQISSLRDLEDRASTKAWEGNVLVVAGLAAAGVGTYYLLRDREVHATVAPVDHGGGAAVVLGGRW
ncbi:MAG: hypothetical protein ABI467_25940 [Kofleriaceae bacterium]